MTTGQQHAVDPGDRFAASRSFPTVLPAPGTGGGSGLGEPVKLYTSDAGPWPVPTDVPAAVPPVVAKGDQEARR